MTVFAAFFDPSNDGFDIADLGLMLAIGFGPVLLLIGWLKARGYSWMTKEIERIVDVKVKEYTQPIQPGYRNGGESLADVSHNLKLLMDHIGIKSTEE